MLSVNTVQMKITIIGSGNIGSALVTGLLREGKMAAGDITLTDVSPEVLAPFAAKGVCTMQSNIAAVSGASTVILCVKPYLISDVVSEILPSLSRDTLLVSFAAGITLNQLTLFAGKRPLFRVIPNTAMAVCQSMTCIAASGDTCKSQHDAILQFFSRVGKAILIDESLMNAATVIASCGTAFALRYLRASMVAAVEIGFRPAVAEAMIAQTMLGAAALLTESGNHPEAEIDKVTTPKGITVKGINSMEQAGFTAAVLQGIRAAYNVLEA